LNLLVGPGPRAIAIGADASAPPQRPERRRPRRTRRVISTIDGTYDGGHVPRGPVSGVSDPHGQRARLHPPLSCSPYCCLNSVPRIQPSQDLVDV
jgi:hypothetical protein